MAVDIEQIEARFAAVTPGPWEVIPYSRPNAEFIAHAPADIAALIAEVRRLRGEVEDWRETALHHQEVADDYRDHANAMARQRDELQAKIDAVREALDHIEQSPYANASTEIRRALGEQ